MIFIGHYRFSGLLIVSLAIFCGSVAAQTFEPGKTYFDATGYVEYRAGNLPIIISAPHGGDLEPNSIPDRDCSGCVSSKDLWTQTIAEGMYAALVEQTGCYPHVIINLLHRKKFDANRNINDAADGNPTVEQAWFGYHAFIDSAKAAVNQDYGQGLFLDIHGHGHDIQRIELGYLLSKSELQLSNLALNHMDLIDESSIKNLVQHNEQGLEHSELIRGASSFGSLLEMKDFASVPSSFDPFPFDDESYFSGGYNTRRHGSRDQNIQIDAIQIELNQDVRFIASTRNRLIDSISRTAIEFIDMHYNDDFIDQYCNIISDVEEPVQFDNSTEMFPNPASEYFNLLTDEKSIEVMIYNSLGQKVMSKVWQGSKINIESLPTGHYFVQLRSGSGHLGVLKLAKRASKN